jgi:anaerobic C4-dicarboxylate transporter
MVAIAVGAECGGGGVGVGVGAGLIVNFTVLFVVPSAFVALRVTLVIPAVVGVPEMRPVL